MGVNDRRKTHNTSRLSMALTEVPLTPIGMKGPRKKLGMNSLGLKPRPVNKLSLKNRKEANNQNRFVELPVPEENLAPPSQPINQSNKNRFQELYANDSVVLCEPEETPESGSGKLYPRLPKKKGRESLFSEIDDGSFIELSVQEVEKKADTSVEVVEERVDTFKIPDVLYYTSQMEQDETQYSTSTKTPNAAVGFRRFVENVKKHRKIFSGSKETTPLLGETSEGDKFHETIVGGCRDILTGFSLKNNTKYEEMNSTLINPAKKKTLLYPDISSLSIESDEKRWTDPYYEDDTPLKTTVTYHSRNQDFPLAQLPKNWSQTVNLTADSSYEVSPDKMSVPFKLQESSTNETAEGSTKPYVNSSPKKILAPVAENTTIAYFTSDEDEEEKSFAEMNSQSLKLFMESSSDKTEDNSRMVTKDLSLVSSVVMATPPKRNRLSKGSKRKKSAEARKETSSKEEASLLARTFENANPAVVNWVISSPFKDRDSVREVYPDLGEETLDMSALSNCRVHAREGMHSTSTYTVGRDARANRISPRNSTDTMTNHISPLKTPNKNKTDDEMVRENVLCRSVIGLSDLRINASVVESLSFGSASSIFTSNVRSEIEESGYDKFSASDGSDTPVKGGFGRTRRKFMKIFSSDDEKVCLVGEKRKEKDARKKDEIMRKQTEKSDQSQISKKDETKRKYSSSLKTFSSKKSLRPSALCEYNYDEEWKESQSKDHNVSVRRKTKLKSSTALVDTSNEENTTMSESSTKKTKDKSRTISESLTKKKDKDRIMSESSAKKTDKNKTMSESSTKKKDKDRTMSESSTKKKDKDRTMSESSTKKKDKDRTMSESSTKKKDKDRTMSESSTKKKEKDRTMSESSTKKKDKDRTMSESSTKKKDKNKIDSESSNKKLKDKNKIITESSSKNTKEESNLKAASPKVLTLDDIGRVELDEDGLFWGDVSRRSRTKKSSIDRKDVSTKPKKKPRKLTPIYSRYKYPDSDDFNSGEDEHIDDCFTEDSSPNLTPKKISSVLKSVEDDSYLRPEQLTKLTEHMCIKSLKKMRQKETKSKIGFSQNDVFKTPTKSDCYVNFGTRRWRDSPRVILSDSESDKDDIVRRLTPSPIENTRPPLTRVFPQSEGVNKVRKKVVKKMQSTALTELSMPQNNSKLSFLKSLSALVDLTRAHPDAIVYVRQFKKEKMNLTQVLYKYYNENIFENKLPEEMNIKWNTRMTKTAGYCYYQLDKSKPTGRGARLELSNKVIDVPERLRDTLVHELCHAAAWIISSYKEGHGPLWKAWANKAMEKFPELPAINRCHSYEINCKYTYQCINCKYSIGRHSKSLNTDLKVCGYCYGKFELIVNDLSASAKKNPYFANTPGTPNTPASVPKTPKFAEFVREHYSVVKKSGVKTHGEVMKVLSLDFAKIKTKLKPD